MGRVFWIGMVGFVILIAFYVSWCNRPNNGIYPISRDAVLLEGECIVINWGATIEDADLALARWKVLKARAKLKGGKQ